MEKRDIIGPRASGLPSAHSRLRVSSKEHFEMLNAMFFAVEEMSLGVKEVDFMEMATKCISGYDNPPWIFKGSALYQFHLVKAEVARAIIPKEFRLVETFGYTLGGFFLANYKESPFGPFDELVTIAGITRKPPLPTSHAWAARVFVNSDNARRHGREVFGLPSQVATFSKSEKTVSKRKKNVDVQVAEMDGPVATSLFDIRFESPILKTNPLKWLAFGPKIKMSLPSFSGRTEHTPQLLKYSCQIECRVKPTSRARVLESLERIDTSESQVLELNECSRKREMTLAVMLSKPIFALEFNCLKMEVHPPVVVSEPIYSDQGQHQNDNLIK